MARKKILLDTEQVELVARLTGLGLNMQQVADALGISKDTLERRVTEDENLRLGLAQGRAKAATAVAETAFKLATSGEHPAMTMFWLKTRLGWRENEHPIEAPKPKTMKVYTTTVRNDGVLVRDLIEQIVNESDSI